MKLLTTTVGALALISGGLSTPALADYYQEGGSRTTTCMKRVYREEYIPGTSKSNPGRVRSWYERKKVPCQGHVSGQVRAPRRAPRTQPQVRGNAKDARVDDNSCIEGSIIGGIAGGAAGGTLATKKNWIWSIPAGVIGGALVGCQVDGG